MNLWRRCRGLVLAASLLGLGSVAVPRASVLAEIADEDLRCLALTIYWEARSETESGQRAVAHTVLNRTRSALFPNSVCGVVTQGGEHPTNQCQFSWWCDGLSDEPTDETAWATAQRIARRALGEASSDPTNGALYFHTGDVRPEWSEEFTVVGKIDSHVYYKPNVE